MKEKTLLEFIQEMSNDLDKFKRYWEAGEKTISAHYPDKLTDADWFEQFVLYQETTQSFSPQK